VENACKETVKPVSWLNTHPKKQKAPPHAFRAWWQGYGL
jgi:hypothetical protein